MAGRCFVVKRGLWSKRGWCGEKAGTGVGEKSSVEMRDIPVESILFSPYQPRGDAGAGLEDLCESIKAHGVIQPIIVRRSGAGFELVAGERRVRACKMAGVGTIPAIVRAYDDRAAALAAMIENVQRAGLHPLDEAEGYRRLAAEFHLTQEEVARAVGLSQPAVANKIRLLKLAEGVKADLRAGRITERHGRALLRLDGSENQQKALGVVLRRKLSVEETESLVGEMLGGKEVPGKRRLRVKVGVFKDIRLFVNSFRSAVRTLRRAGVQATLEERESDAGLEVTMRIPKVDVEGGKAGGRAPG